MRSSNNIKVLEDGFRKLDALERNGSLKALSLLGERLIDDGRTQHEFKNMTFNTQDSYGFAVYYNGDIVVPPQFGEQLAVVGTQDLYVETDGRFGVEKATEFLNDYASMGNGWTLVVTTGTEYSEFLEEELEKFVLSNIWMEAQNPNLLTYYYDKV